MKSFSLKSPGQLFILFALLVSINSIAMASVFVAWVRSPQDPYVNTFCTGVLNKLPYNARFNSANDGWGLTWYGGDVTPYLIESQRRKFHDACNPSAPNFDSLLYTTSSPYVSGCFDNVRNPAATSASRVILGHARKADNLHDFPTPQPCIYDNLPYELIAPDDPDQFNHLPEGFHLRSVFGKPYAFMHNGSWVVSDLEDRLGVGFTALDVFYDRPFGGRIAPGMFVDTEFLGMLVMRNLIAQENYYWSGLGGVPSNTRPAGITSREDWAYCRTAQEFSPSSDPPHDKSSINSVFTDGTTLWAIMKSDNLDPHYVYYNDNWSQGFYRSIVSRENPGGYQNLGQGNFLALTGGEENTAITHSIGIVGDYPNELRVKPEKDLERDAVQPAISVNEADGSFVAVWVTSGGLQTDKAITARWYNQMGMSEDYGFTVHTAVPGSGLFSPAVSHSPDGQTIVVVWLEHGPDLILDATWYLKRKSFTWNNQSHTWSPGATAIVASQLSCGTNQPLAYPSVAFGPYGNYVITWEQMVCNGGFTEIHVKAYQGEQVVFGDQVVTQNAQDHEPDIAYVFNDDNLVDYWAIGYHGLVGETTFAKAVSIGRNRGNGQWNVGNPVGLSQGGQHVSVAALSGTQLYFSYNNGNVRVDRCTDYMGQIILQESAVGEAVDANTQPDIALRGDGTFYICYDKLNAPNGRDIYCASGSGTQLTVEPGTVNLYPASDQTLPVIAIARDYPTNDGFYANNMSAGYFLKRRMIIWQTDGQDGANVSGIAGQFRGINVTNVLRSWYESDDFNATLPPVLPAVVDQSMTISDPLVYMTSSVRVEPGVTLTIQPGVTVEILSQCHLDVQGSLIADGAEFVLLQPSGPTAKWSGIYVEGSVSLTDCILSGAHIGIETSKASSIVLDGCMITNCGTGLVAYQPSGTGEPQLTNCQINGNESDGASLLAVSNSIIDQCEFSGNGGDGLVMTNSYAKIASSDFASNGDSEGGYGLVCFGSSPLLTCNNFDSNQKGEVALYNQSYPVLEAASAGGVNSFFNDTKNLIDMWDSYPLTEDGHNNFTVGSSGYFMADMSASPPKRYISGNFWNPLLTLAALYPSSSNVYVWSSTDQTENSCGSAAGAGSNATQQMFALAMTAQESGDYVTSSALLSDLVEQYPDSVWAAPAVAQLFANQCMIGDGYDTLQDDLVDVSQTNEGTLLGTVAESYSTRLFVEDDEFAPAVDTYTSELAEATSATDSMFAEVDLAITAFRADGGGGSLDQMNVADIHNVFRQMGALAGHTPGSPTASHQGYTAIPKTISLEANFPNPFNAETTIRFYLPVATRAELAVYNIVGQKVVTLTDEYMTAGFHNLKWAAGDYASGVYLYQLKANGVVDTKKMVLIK